MHVAPEILDGIQAALTCRVEGFPQTYRGLPLSVEKLRLSAFNPLIAKVDKYLWGWRALLLSAAGRLVLLDAVLDALPTFAMGALELPPGVLAALDRLRRAFRWVATNKVSGAQCLVAWERVCRPKSEGGLGVRSIADQNTYLMLKLLHRLHCAPHESWPWWVWESQAGLPLDRDDSVTTLCGAHWTSLRRLLPLYRCISRVKIGDGTRAAFWLDWWLPSGPLATPCRSSSRTARFNVPPCDRCSTTGSTPSLPRVCPPWPPNNAPRSSKTCPQFAWAALTTSIPSRSAARPAESSAPLPFISHAPLRGPGRAPRFHLGQLRPVQVEVLRVACRQRPYPVP
jgi:hypothetical protein